MDKKFGYYVFGGMLIGAFLGLGWSANGNIPIGLGIGALSGAAIGMVHCCSGHRGSR
jgi:hypothetical protein